MWCSYHMFKYSSPLAVFSGLQASPVVMLFPGGCFSGFEYLVYGQLMLSGRIEVLIFKTNPWNLEMKYMAFFDLKDGALCMMSGSTKSVGRTWKDTAKTVYTLIVVKRG